MDAERFLAEFGHIANAPGGIQQLREMVYQLAITGALTPQHGIDGDARQLLADITTLRNRLIREKAYKRLPKLESAALDIPSFIELPTSWCWTRLLDIGEISPRNDAPDEAAASFIPMRGFSETHMGALVPETAKWGSIKKGFPHFRNGDVVIAKITPCFENGKAAVIAGLEHSIGAGTTELHVFRPIHAGILPGYIYLFLRSPYFAVEGEKNMTGTAGQRRLPTEYFATRALPLPSSAEQSRIVAKVDELMALCDWLEAQQQARRKLQNNLRQSILQAVTSANSPHELQTSWARLAENFGRLFHVPEDVAGLREVIYQLAVTGRLVVQDSAEGDAKGLLAEISSTRQKLIAEKKYKRALKLESEPLLPPEIGLPSTWQWSRLLDLGEINPRNNAEADLTATFLPMRGVSERHNAPLRGEPRLWGEINKGYTHISNGDVILAKITPCFENGKAAVIRDLNNGLGSGSTEFHVFRSIHPGVLPSFVYLFLKSPLFRFHGEINMVGTAGQKRLPTGYFALHAMPLPTTMEQVRIVIRVNELMTLCDSLESKLLTGKNLAEHLARTAVSSITGIANEQEEEPMKAPQTDLIAPLRLGVSPAVNDQASLATILARNNGEMNAKDLWQRFGGEIDAFYAQLKTEVAHGWILEPTVAEVHENQSNTVSA
ncbi:restriction endonuclease subunit S [Pseudomonas sp. SWRI196]|uniref:Restriction endonuclease subunit S n=1 Tax=Pseudomonas tehranensis TaxID=2745502 RepID=A0ABR6UN89_9PSED|nr:restriction endonuclease subunit S [Pseudomonas tehranensis]MBC3346105.1 restriction endonuclease subunit S [Pseudomonas tehranensis]